ncbi:MAG: translation initiation factor IF-6 [Methanotrichaceae archaeon]|nr:translation initiation factor IF-6 [Methanotrichaceae archaeon]
MQARDKRLKIAGSPLLGVFARCTERVVLVPVETAPEVVLALEEGLGVAAERIHAGGSAVLGSLISGNSQGFVVTQQTGEEEMKKLSLHGRVARLPGKINAAGNLILANDSAALVHPGLSEKACETVSRTLGVEVVAGTIGGLKTVGMTAAITNRGLLVHPRVLEAEIAVLDDLFQLPVDVGTVNFGSPLVGSGLLANGHGYFAGDETTGPELGRIEDALGFLA